MKLKTRLSLIFGTVVLVIVATIGIVTYNKNVEMGTADAKKTMQISAELAAKEIEGKLSDFKNMAQASGYDSVLASSGQDDVVANHIDNLAENYEFTSGNILTIDGVSRKDGTDFSDRDYVKEALAGNVNISDLTLSKYTGNYGFSVASPVYEKNGEINGVVYFRMDVDFMSKILDQIVISEGSYTYLVDGNGMVIVHPDESLIGEYNITDAEKGMGSVSDMILSQTSGAGAYDNNGTEYLCGYSPVAGTNGWTIVVTAPKNDFMGATYDTMKTLLVVDVVALVVALVLAVFFAGSIGEAAHQVSLALTSLSEGNLNHEIKPGMRTDEIGKLQNSARELQQTFKKIINETSSFSFLVAIAIVQIPVALIYLKITKQKFLDIFNELKTGMKEYKYSIVGSLLNVLGTGCLLVSFNFGMVSIVSPLTAIYTPIVLIYSFIVLKEQMNKTNFAGIISALIGTFGIIMLG